MERSAVGSKVRPESGATQIKSNGRVIVIIIVTLAIRVNSFSSLKLAPVCYIL